MSQFILFFFIDLSLVLLQISQLSEDLQAFYLKNFQTFSSATREQVRHKKKYCQYLVIGKDKNLPASFQKALKIYQCVIFHKFTLFLQTDSNSDANFGHFWNWYQCWRDLHHPEIHFVDCEYLLFKFCVFKSLGLRSIPETIDGGLWNHNG